MRRSKEASKDEAFLEEALRLAKRGYGRTSPNPMVGAVLVRAGKVIGRGYHHRAGSPHAEIEALRDAARRTGISEFRSPSTTLYITLEPCCTQGRTPPCTEAILASKVSRVVIGSIDPNPRHSGRGIKLLRQAGIDVTTGVLQDKVTVLNEAFNHWIVRGTPLVTVKAAMTLDGKIATRTGESKWITGPVARAYAMRLRQGSDAILVGIRTVLADNPHLTRRSTSRGPTEAGPGLRRIILDSEARTPLQANVVADEDAARTVIVVTERAPKTRVRDLQRHVTVWTAPMVSGGVDLGWLSKRLGAVGVTSLLVEGGGTVNWSFLFGGFAQRVAFFYAPMILGDREAIKGVGGAGVCSLADSLRFGEVEWRRLGRDLLLSARVIVPRTKRP
jgi:diaminohydroxyphosphoribosylaminopyrimidine deaminase/5-amino-6-(5-phosphoribosylamino)uracil reductase